MDVSTLRIMRVVLSCCVSCIDHVVAVVTEGLGLSENKIMRYGLGMAIWLRIMREYMCIDSHLGILPHDHP